MPNDTSIRQRNISVLLIDDEELILNSLHTILQHNGYAAYCASGEKQALDIIGSYRIDVALIDLMIGKENGIEVMTSLREKNPNLLPIIMTGYGTIEKAVEAMQQGAWDFLAKPVTSGILLEKLGKLEEICLLRRGQDFREKVLNRDFEFSGLIGPSPVMTPIYESVLRAAASSLPVLIEGETGSGKEFFAEAIHLNSARMKNPYVVMDCNATPSTLIEATLFGSMKGAFTGAVERKGLLEASDKGSLFLDEVGEIDLEIQPKLLRCLETGRFRAVGATKESASDFRIICATNRDMQAETKERRFRPDLFYRISAIRISLPPLRERAADIPVLARGILARIAEENKRTTEFSPEAIKALSSFDWPGNIRQLRFVIESAFFQSTDDKIRPEHLPIESSSRSPAIHDSIQAEASTELDFKSYREKAIISAETAYIKALLEEVDGDVRAAAKKAGLTREAMYRVMARCNLSASEFRPDKE